MAYYEVTIMAKIEANDAKEAKSETLADLKDGKLKSWMKIAAKRY